MNNNEDKPLIELNIWVVYGTDTLDFPGMFVGRLFQADKPTGNFYAHADLEAVRTWVHYESKLLGEGHLYRLKRQPDDDPVILETWV